MNIETIKTIWANDELKQNTYVVIGNDSCILIDAGCSIKDVYEIFNKPIEAVFLTHGHYDHIKYIEEYDKLNIPIYAHKNLKEIISSPDKNVSSLFDKPTRYKIKNLNIITDNEEVLVLGNKMRCIYTPGHSFDSTSYLYKNNLFSGDCLFSVAIGRIDLPTANSNDMINSLNKLNNLNYSKLYPGHGRLSDKTEQTENISKWLSLFKK